MIVVDKQKIELNRFFKNILIYDKLIIEVWA